MHPDYLTLADVIEMNRVWASVRVADRTAERPADPPDRALGG